MNIEDLDERDRREIVKLAKRHVSHTTIATKFGLSLWQVLDLVRAAEQES